MASQPRASLPPPVRYASDGAGGEDDNDEPRPSLSPLVGERGCRREAEMS